MIFYFAIKLYLFLKLARKHIGLTHFVSALLSWSLLKGPFNFLFSFALSNCKIVFKLFYDTHKKEPYFYLITKLKKNIVLFWYSYLENF